MWAYNGQHESANGCWSNKVCLGNGAWTLFDGRKIQWFCSEAQKKQVEGKTIETDLKYPLKRAVNKENEPIQHFKSYKESCTKDEDCKLKKLGICTKFFWLGTKDAEAFGYGSACYSWDDPVCPSDKPFGSKNRNYDNVGHFSYYT